MKSLFAILLTALTLNTASADFIPGRVRPGMKSDMTAVSSTGTFSAIKNALVTLNYEDGKSEPVSLSVTFPGQTRTVTYLMSNVSTSSCGDHFEANQIQSGTIHNSIQLVDYSRATCERVIQNLWEVSLQQSNPGHQSSVLQLVGKPEAIYVTL